MVVEKGAQLEISGGTLSLVLAAGNSIVVATDSRRTFSTTGERYDNCKKLFIVAKTRALAIAGLVDMVYPRLPWLTTEISVLLQAEIAKHEFWDDLIWNNRRKGNYEQLPVQSPGYAWWISIASRLQTIYSIALTYGSAVTEKSLNALLAGFKDNGEAQIECFSIVPQKRQSSSGRPTIGTLQSRDQVATKGGFIWKAIGATNVADIVLGGIVTEEAKTRLEHCPAIVDFLNRRENHSVDLISESEMRSLAEEIILATADLTDSVGRHPLQIATIRPGQPVEYRGPEFPQSSFSLPQHQSWHQARNFPENAKFADAKGGVFTFCEVVNNQRPVPLGDNYFYGNTFTNAKFVYKDGEIFFGENNKLSDCTLIILDGVSEVALPVDFKSKFTRVIYACDSAGDR
jgi:hypothetical protein